MGYSKIIITEDLGVMEYSLAWEYQKQLVQQRLNKPHLPDILLLVEHPPVYTLGTGSTLNNLKFDPDNFSGQLYRTERGGEVTYHCLGQIVVYPILNLRHHQQDLHWYLRQLEEVVIGVLGNYGVKAHRISGLTGVWVDNEKISAVGIKVKRWITMHGLAFNLCCDLSGFAQIIPCGIEDKSVTSLHRLIPHCPSVDEMKKEIIRMFVNVFHYEEVVED